MVLLFCCTYVCARDNVSPLAAASKAGHFACVEALIGSKADVLQRDK